LIAEEKREKGMHKFFEPGLSIGSQFEGENPLTQEKHDNSVEDDLLVL
jgi:hypothetical protein